MKSLPVVLAALLLIVACAPEAAEEPPESAEPEEVAEPAMDAEVAVEAVTDAYVAHYNRGDAPAIAGLFTDDAVTLFADGGVNVGPSEIEAAHDTAMVMNPQITIESAETVTTEDLAVQRGTYVVETHPEEGEPTSFSGAYLTEFTRVDGEWKIAAVISNYDSEPPAGMPAGNLPEEIPEDLAPNPLAPLTDAYMEHFNAGQADLVARLYTEDAHAAFAGSPWVQGREAIEAAVAERIAMGSPELAIHTVATADLDDGSHVGGGWFEMLVTTDQGEVTRAGNWILVTRVNDAGEHEIDWLVNNLVPTDIPGM